MHGTLKALREFQRARYRLDDERRVALGTGHKLSAEIVSRLEKAKSESSVA